MAEAKSQLVRKKAAQQREALIPINDDEHKERKKRKRKGKWDGALLFGIFFMMTILAVVAIALVVSAFGPAGKVNKTIIQVSDMVDKVNKSGLADVVVTAINIWQTGNHTQQTFSLLNAVYTSGAQVTDIVMAIQPEIIKELANRTSITVTGLLVLAETIINNQGIDITIPLGTG